MDELVSAALRQDEEAKKDRLAKALALLATSYDKTTYYARSYDAYICADLHRVAKSAVEGKDSRFVCIAELHREGLLDQSIKELNTAGKLKGIDPDEVDALLNASANAKKQVAASSTVINYSAHGSRTQFSFFDPKKDKAALGAAIGVGVLAVGGLATAFTFMSLASTTISTSAVAMAAVAGAAAAGTAFPPLGIAIITLSCAAILAAIIILAVLAKKGLSERQALAVSYAGGY